MEFLEARISEDELSVSIRGDGSHRMHSWDIVGTYNPGCPDCRGVAGTARVLAECAAKRAIILLADDVEGLDYQVTSEWGGEIDGTGEAILRAIAAVYKDHPDYQQEWANQAVI